MMNSKVLGFPRIPPPPPLTGTWDSYPAIIAGLATVSGTGYSKPSVFNISGTWYLVTGNFNGTFEGYELNTSTLTWSANAAIITGLTDVGSISWSHMFDFGGTTYIMVNAGNGAFIAKYWNGSGWITDASLISGLPTSVNYGKSIFKMGGTYYMIKGYFRDLLSYRWTGSTWSAYTAIRNGMVYTGTDTAIDVNVFTYNGYYYAILTSQNKKRAYRWESGIWVQDDALVYDNIAGFIHQTNTVFQIDTDLYLIHGNGSGIGTFIGYKRTF